MNRQAEVAGHRLRVMAASHQAKRLLLLFGKCRGQVRHRLYLESAGLLLHPEKIVYPGGMGPVKRSIMIAGHATSISQEPVFWDALRAAAAAEELPLNALVARIDAERVRARSPANLASAIRVWLFEREKAR